MKVEACAATGSTRVPASTVSGSTSRAALVAAVSSHRIRPVRGRVFPFDDAPAAFRHHLGGTAIGKVVISLEPTSDNGRK